MDFQELEEGTYKRDCFQLCKGQKQDPCNPQNYYSVASTSL